MPTDLTPFFKAKGKVIAQKRLKEANADEVSSKCEEPSLTYRGIARMANKIAREIHDFVHILLSKRRDYLDFNATIASMSNADRDKFDHDSERGLRALTELVLQLLERITNEKVLSDQENDHLKAVCGLLEKDIKKFGRVVTEMRRLRITSMANRRELSKLSAMVANRKKKTLKILSEETNSLQGSPKNEIRKRYVNSDLSEEKKPMLDKTNKNKAFMDDESSSTDMNIPLNKKEQLQKENDKLFKKYTSTQDTVNNLETQIFEIQRLQETFSDKVFDQEKEIEMINEIAINTTENIRDANEWIRQAINNSAGRRVVLLFCIVVLTFTLLFLDWYNP